MQKGSVVVAIVLLWKGLDGLDYIMACLHYQRERDPMSPLTAHETEVKGKTPELLPNHFTEDQQYQSDTPSHHTHTHTHTHASLLFTFFQTIPLLPTHTTSHQTSTTPSSLPLNPHPPPPLPPNNRQHNPTRSKKHTEPHPQPPNSLRLETLRPPAPRPTRQAHHGAPFPPRRERHGERPGGFGAAGRRGAADRAAGEVAYRAAEEDGEDREG